MRSRRIIWYGFLSLATLLVVAAAASALTGGPDGYGYKFIDSDESDGPVYEWTDLSTMSPTTVTLFDDDNIAVPIGFSYEFYGNQYTNAYIGSNGYISFGSGYWEYWPSSLPSGGNPNNFVAGTWHDLNPSCGAPKIQYATTGSPGSQMFIVEYSDVNQYSNCLDPPEVSMQIKLFEGQETVEVHYKEVVSNGQQYVKGIENLPGTIALQHSYSSTNLDEFAIRYYVNGPPIIGVDSYTFVEDPGPQTLDVFANDSDPDGDPMSLVSFSQPAVGTITHVPGPGLGTFTFDAFPDVNTPGGPDTFSYTLADDKGLQATGTVTLTLLPVNDAPSFTPKGDITVLEGGPGQVVGAWAQGLKAGPADEKGQKMSWTSSADKPEMFSYQPSFTNGGTLVFETKPDAAGIATVSYTVKDTGGTANGGQDTTAGTFLIIVTPVNDAPSFTAGPDVVVAEDEGAVALPWATNIKPGPATALDEATQALTFLITNDQPGVWLAPPAIDASGLLTFEAAPQACTGAPANLQVRLQDSGGTSDGGVDLSPIHLMKLEVTCINDPPVAIDDDYTGAIGPYVPKDHTGFAMPVLANDYDLDGEPLNILSVSLPKHGQLTATPMGYTYKPLAGFTGPDSFQYTLIDSQSAKSTAKVSIIIACPGVKAFPETYSIDEDTPLAIPAPGVLGNDQFPGSAVTAVTVPPVHGDVTMSSDGAFTYTPDPHWSGVDQFSYVMTAGSCSYHSTVGVTTAAVPDPPTATNDYLLVPEDTPTLLGILDNDSGAPDAGDTITLTSWTPTTHGTLALKSGALWYTPKLDHAGTDAFSYTITDSQGLTATADVHLVVVDANDAPQPAADLYLVRPDTVNKVAGDQGVLRNDVDPEGKPMIAMLEAAPKHGALVLFADGGFTYAPIPGYKGPDEFRYRPVDDLGLEGPAVAVALDVRVNAPPVAAFRPGEETVRVGIPVTFFDESKDPDGTLVSWQWDFGTGVSSERNPAFAFEAPGERRVQLTVVDDDGAVDITQRLVRIVTEYAAEEGGTHLGKRPVARAGADLQLRPGAAAVLNGTGSDNAVGIQWRQVAGPAVDLVDAATLMPSFVVPDLPAGTQFAFELVIFDGQRDSLPDLVEVRIAPAGTTVQPTVNAGADRIVRTGDLVILQGEVHGFVDPTLRWTQLAGPPAVLVDQSFTARQEGRYVFSLAASDAHGVRTDTVTIEALAADGFTFDQSRSRDGAWFRFQSLVDGDVVWDFGDGATSTEANPVHRFDAGVYQVTMQRSDGETFVKTVEVHEVGDKESPAPAAFLLLTLVLLLVRRRRVK